MSIRDSVAPLAEGAVELVTSEVTHWRNELARPWVEGRQTPEARIGRWIGLSLAIGALVIGVATAMRAERPWE